MLLQITKHNAVPEINLQLQIMQLEKHEAQSQRQVAVKFLKMILY